MDSFQKAFGEIEKPRELINYGDGADGINQIISRSIDFLFTIAAVAFVIMFLWSAFQMIISGGDKEAVAKSRARLTWAIIGLALLSLSFAIFKVIGDITGFKLTP